LAKLSQSNVLLLIFSLVLTACQKTDPSLARSPLIYKAATATTNIPRQIPGTPAIKPIAKSRLTVRINSQRIAGAAPVLYGSNSWWTDQDADIWRSRHKELGLNVLRVPTAQSLFEPINDDVDPNHINPQGFMFDFPLPWSGRTVTLRKWLEMLKGLDVTVMLNIPYLAGWLSTNGDQGLSSTYPPNDIAEYREYVRALLQFTVHQVGYPAEKVILEPVNEPDLACSPGEIVSCFWQNWSIQDLIIVLRTTYEEAKKVDPAIRVVGVSECCGTTIVDQLLAQFDGLSYLDGFTYHKYVNDFNFDQGINWGTHLASFGRPVYLNEFGNMQVWSNGISGALWHASILPQIWKAKINPLQFPISDFPGSHQGFNQLGLFNDWNDNWRIKPAYWVYTNFYQQFGGGELVFVEAPESLSIIASRKLNGGKLRLAIWITNLSHTPVKGIKFSIEGFHEQTTFIQTLDNLKGSTPEETLQITGAPIEFYFDLPAESSYCILISSLPSDSRMFLPIIER
jgi:hypothetical protein